MKKRTRRAKRELHSEKARHDLDKDTCDICGRRCSTFITCPNGKEICRRCFDDGYDGDHFYDDNDFHHFIWG